MWQESLYIFLQQFVPATAMEESTHCYSTRQIQCMLMDHCGDYIAISDVHQSLKDRGFSVASIAGDLELMWLFKIK
jgi:hypothetical protein